MKRTVVDQMEVVVAAHNTVQVRFRKLLDVEGQTMDLGLHRISIEPGALDANSLAQLNESLRMNKIGEVSAAEWQKVVDFCKFAHTPEVITSFVAARASALEAQAKA